MNKKTFSIFALGFLCAFALSGSTAHAATLTNPQNSLGLVGYWPMDSVSGTTVPDRSGNGNNGTTSGSPTAAAGKIGKALNFSGSQYVAVPMTINYSAITVSAWIKPSTVSAGNSRILANSHTDQDHKGFQLWFNNGGTTGVFDVGNGSSEGPVYWSSTLIPGNWYLYTGVYDGTHVYVYINGVQVGSANYAGGSIAASGYSLNIGRNPTYGGDYFRGVIDDARVYNRALSATEVANLYQNTLSVSTRSSSPTNLVTNGLVGYWTFDGANTNWTSNTTTDVSGNGNTGTLINMSTTTSPIMGRFGQALSFDGSSQYVSVPNNSSLNPTAITISAWIKADSFPNTYNTIVQKGFSGPYCEYFVKNNGKLALYCNSVYDGTGTYTLVPGVWYNVVLTHDSVNGTRGYVNGNLDGSAGGGGTLGSNAANLCIGNDCYTPGRKFDGSIDDVRVYNRVLSASEVEQLYNAGAPGGGAVVGQSPVNPLSGGGLVGYWPFDGNSLNWATNQALDMSGNGNNGTLVNMSTTTSPVIGKIGQALSLNGSTSYVNAGSASQLDDLGPMTVVAWIKPNSTGGSARERFVSKAAGTNLPTAGWAFYVAPSGDGVTKALKFAQEYSTSHLEVIASSNTLTLGVWQLVAVTWDGTANYSGVHIYSNGKEVSYDTRYSGAGARVSDASNSFLIGNDPTQAQGFDGAIDDVRVYNRALSASEVKTLYNLGR